ncbi:hypothetical protein [uncultured Erythrobacter sp.]|uniref:hypothetical protein n=1 Tax=uncultured Erythrobacter sp. TaxID=263913 RepID=UPI00260BB4C3|nr:hypothetical protein [uncultured Erythrobacter sp.]
MAARGQNRTKIKQQLKEGENGPLNRHWRGVFLDFLAESSNVTKAAEEAGINPSRAYKVRREEPEFAKQWRVALLEGYEHLELETLRRLRVGTKADGPKFDIANALRLLVLHRETVARAQAEQRNVSAAEVRASIDRKVEAIRQQVQDEKRRGAARK